MPHEKACPSPPTAGPGVVFRAALAIATAVLMSAPGGAAEFRLRRQCHCRGPLVTLGDVAEIYTADGREAERLAAVELFPAPAAPRQRFVRLREIQDRLLLRGINLADHRFSGSSQVAVMGVGGETSGIQSEKPLSSSTARRAHRRVREAVLQYLQQHASAEGPWTVGLELDAAAARLAGAPGNRLAVSGGRPPWIGLQTFEVAADTPEGPARFLLQAEVTRPSAVVVAVRSLPRDALIRAGDVALDWTAAGTGPVEGFHSLDEVVGMQATRAIPAGKVIAPGSIRAPLLVRRGEVVTVRARSPGICVRTQARARDDGSLGELVAVESLLERKVYFARVEGVREVEVYARAHQADAVPYAQASRR